MSDTREAELDRAAVEAATGLMKDLRAKGTPIDEQIETVVRGLFIAQSNLEGVRAKLGHLEGSTRLLNEIVRDVSKVAAASIGAPSEQAKGALLAQSERALAQAQGHLGAIAKQADPAIETAVSALESAVALLQEQLRRLSQKQWDHIVERDPSSGVIVAMRSIPFYPS